MKTIAYWLPMEIRCWLTALGWRRGAVVIALGLTAQQIWFWEIILIKGWAGLNWTGPPFVGAGMMTILIAVALVVAASRKDVFRSGTPDRMVFILIASGLLFVIFLVTAGVLMLGHDPRPFMLLCIDSAIACLIAYLLTVLGPLVALTYAAALTIRNLLRRFGAALSVRPLRNIVVALLLMPPVSILTIEIFPAISGSRDYIHAVKMGYPAFWSVVLLAMAVARSSKKSAPA